MVKAKKTFRASIQSNSDMKFVNTLKIKTKNKKVADGFIESVIAV
jgi:hypothetical protein